MNLLESQFLLPQQKRLNSFEALSWAWMLQLASQVPMELPGTGASKLSSETTVRCQSLAWDGAAKEAKRERML